MRRDAREHMAKPGERLHRVPFAHGNEAQQHGRSLAAIVATEKRPVAAADGDVAVGPLGGAIVDLQIAVFEKALQSVPLIQRIAHGLCGRALGQNFVADLDQIFVQFRHHRHR